MERGQLLNLIAVLTQDLVDVEKTVEALYGRIEKFDEERAKILADLNKVTEQLKKRVDDNE